VARRQPVARESVVFGEIGELVPGIVDTIDLAVVRPVQVALELQIVGWIGEDHVDALRRERGHHLDRIALDNPVERRLGVLIRGRLQFRRGRIIPRGTTLDRAANLGHRHPPNPSQNLGRAWSRRVRRSRVFLLIQSVIRHC